MNIQELIKEHHGAMVAKGFYDCPDCGIEKGWLCEQAVQGDMSCDHDHRGCGEKDNCGEYVAIKCGTCKGSGINQNINIGQSIMLIVTELSEAVEADRKNHFCTESILDKSMSYEGEKYITYFENCVKNSLQDEMADVYLRLYDLCGYLNILPNDVRGRVNWRTENTADRLRQISRKVLDLNPDYPESKDFKTTLGYVFLYLDVFCFEKNIDIEKHKVAKMQYNKSREHLHGKKY